MSLGEKLCNARLAMKQTTSEVAAATRMKVQTVEHLEREEFDEIPAPIYAKGFLKLYAEHVGLDAAPLIEEYVSRFSPNSSGRIDSDAQPNVHKLLQTGPGATDEEELARDEGDLFDGPGNHREVTASFSSDRGTRPSLSDVWSRVADALRRGLQALAPREKTPSDGDEKNGESFVAAAMAKMSWRSLGAIAAVLFVLALLASLVAQCARRPEGGDTSIAPVPVEKLRLAVEPPDPYID